MRVLLRICSSAAVFLTILLNTDIAFAQQLALEAQFRTVGDTMPVVILEKEIVANEVFVTGQFSADSPKYFIVTGRFPDGCYAWKRYDVKHVSPTEHEVRFYATVSNRICLKAADDFAEEITLSKGDVQFPPGEHILRLFDENGAPYERTFRVD